MKNRIVISIVLLILFTTFITKQKIIITKFNLEEIIIENNFILKDIDIKKLLIPIYNQNLIFIKNKEIKKIITQNSFIDSFDLKKKYPNTLQIKIYEKKPIAILFNKQNKFYLSEKIDLIEFKNLPNYRNLPYIFGDKDQFEILYNNLNKINFPFDEIKKYTLFESNRWDLNTKDNSIIRLPANNYTKNLENYLNIKNKKDFKKYKIFDYRIESQLILK